MAAAVRRVLGEPELAERLRIAALAEVQQYTWPRVRQRWTEVYASVLSGTRVVVRTA
jgi:glycosyltransferase involved in cell wall biosynthesis